MRRAAFTIALVAFLALVAVSAYGYATLPPTIPTKFDLAGRVAAWGPKSTIWWLPGVLALGLTLLYASYRTGTGAMRLPFEVADAKVDVARSLTRDMMAVLAAAMSLLFLILQVAIVQSARNLGASPLLTPAILLVVVGMIALIAGYSVAVYRATRTG